MQTYRKIYTVHNTLITYEVWERHQTAGWKTHFGTGVPPSVFDVTGGVADVYYRDVFRTFRTVMSEEYRKDPGCFRAMMDEYEAQLEALHAAISRGQPLKNTKELTAFAKQFEEAWIGLDLSYMPDYVELDASDERRSAAAREKAFGFYIGVDRLIRQTCEALYPDLGDFSWYVTLDEIQNEKIPTRKILEARAKHFIYYKGEIITDLSFDVFCTREQIRTESVYAPLRKEIHGQIGSEGSAKGTAFVLTATSSRNMIKPGSILIAHDLDFADLPLIEQASALILDAGTYYGPAAISARTFSKPCLFDTKIATMVLKTGDELKVDGINGTITLELKS
ncbi:MAG: PEP-utilizing enzyme [Patescibacteria group bacterium]|jgi:phosphohistidine swiveling domain-containing protein